MNIEYQLEKMTLHAESRAKFSRFISENQALPRLIQILQHYSEYRRNAIVAIEFYARAHWEEVLKYSEEIIDISGKVSSETEKRCIAKLLEKITEFQHLNPDFNLPQQSLEKIAALSFDWLLDGSKTATKVFAMQSLFYVGFKIDWIHPELKAYLQHNFMNASAGFRSRSTKILKKLR
ncbi:hypothetical protein [Zunongwangia pacifica]|uniref:Adenylosuccinate lyase n=1 Tax=Zunongwangia pacifica TaxID=2911062 RepID=A0A9X1ZTE6_9FLAO|nr:hypothetical protein [Zunongwangia pacifica]MCL6217388.1 hypothetical protein [Zunongwangia pacifica]